MHIGLAEDARDAPWCNDPIVANSTVVADRAGREALNTLAFSNQYLGYSVSSQAIQGVSADRVEECETIGFPSPRNRSSLQETSNAFTKLNQLLHMYLSVWRLMELYENEMEFVQAEYAKLDIIRLTFFRFSNQLEQYLQVHRCSCSQTQCVVEGYDKESIEEEIERLHSDQCTYRKLLNVIMLELRDVAKTTLFTLPGGPSRYSIHPYEFCRTLPTLSAACIGGDNN